MTAEKNLPAERKRKRKTTGKTEVKKAKKVKVRKGAKEPPGPGFTTDSCWNTLVSWTEPVMAIDMSLTSPGVVVWRPMERQWWCYGVRHTEKEVLHRLERFQPLPNVQIELHYCTLDKLDGVLELCPASSTGSYTRQSTNARITRMTTTTELIVKLATEHRCTTVVIEGYSLNSKMSQTLLSELGGILRFRLHHLGISLHEVPPLRVKKYITGKGRMKKHELGNELLRTLEGVMKFPSLFRVSGIPRYIGVRERKTVPHPLEDVIDACALMTTFLTQQSTR